jgi:hypothetical protein
MLKKELKELKDHEHKLLNDNDELGDENVKLQRQVILVFILSLLSIKALY